MKTLVKFAFFKAYVNLCLCFASICFANKWHYGLYGRKTFFSRALIFKCIKGAIILINLYRMLSNMFSLFNIIIIIILIYS